MIELFLSTDGKHTVHASADTVEGIYKLAPEAQTLYETVVRAYGNKAQMWQEVVNGNGKGHGNGGYQTISSSGNGLTALKPAVAASPLQPQPEAPECPVHHRAMVYRQGRRGAFWSCPAKYEDGSWCRNTIDAGSRTASPKGGESHEVHDPIQPGV